MKLSGSGKHRLFFALDFNEEFKQQLADWRLSLALQGHWIEKENFHLTLMFLGNIKNHQVFDIVDLIQPPQIKPFTLTAENIGFFPRNHILFATISKGTEEALQLMSALQQQLKPLDFIKHNKRRQQPHITLSREATMASDILTNTSISTQIPDFVLMESITIKSGVYYEVVESWPLYQGSVKEQLLGL